MLRPIDTYFSEQDEPLRSCLHFLREYIPKQDPDITEAWKYNMPFFCYKGKMMCYIRMHKKYLQPYIGFVDGKYMNHPALIAENRARIKILLIDPVQDIPLDELNAILTEAIALYS